MKLSQSERAALAPQNDILVAVRPHFRLKREVRPILDSATRGQVEQLTVRNPSITPRTGTWQSRGLVVPTSRTARAATTVFNLPELRANILKFTDPISRERLSEVSRQWEADLQEDAAFVRRVEVLLGVAPGTGEWWALPASAQKTAQHLASMVRKLVAHLDADITAEEQFVGAAMPHEARSDLTRLAARISKLHKAERDAFWNKVTGAGLVGAGIAVGVGGAYSATWLYKHGWCATAGYAWDAVERVYQKTKPADWYNPRPNPNWGYDPEDYWVEPPERSPTTPESCRASIAICAALGGFAIGWAGVDRWREGNNDRRYANALRGELLARCTNPRSEFLFLE